MPPTVKAPSCRNSCVRITGILPQSALANLLSSAPIGLATSPLRVEDGGMAQHSMHGGADHGPGAPPARPLKPPYNEVPVAAPVEAMLAHTDQLALFVTEFLVFSTGLTFALELAQHPASADEHVLEAWLSPPHLAGRDRPFFGVEYADGRYTVHDSWAGNDPAAATLAEIARRRGDRWPILRPTGGRGQICRYQVTWFLCPLPPPGDVRLHLAWPSQHLQESSAVIDADEILRAADQVRQLWPWQPEPAPSASNHLDPTAAPPPPPAGWFASHSGPPHA